MVFNKKNSSSIIWEVLKYVFTVSDSILLKIYAILFLSISLFLTILCFLAIVYWSGQLQGIRSMRVWGSLSFLILIYLIIEFILFIPVYIPFRSYSKKDK